MTLVKGDFSQNGFRANVFDLNVKVGQRRSGLAREKRKTAKMQRKKQDFSANFSANVPCVHFRNENSKHRLKRFSTKST